MPIFAFVFVLDYSATGIIQAVGLCMKNDMELATYVIQSEVCCDMFGRVILTQSWVPLKNDVRTAMLMDSANHGPLSYCESDSIFPRKRVSSFPHHINKHQLNYGTEEKQDNTISQGG